MPTIRGITEVVLLVRDVERSLAFYRDLLGLEVMAQPDSRGAVFLYVGKQAKGVPQQVVLVPLPPDAPGPPSERMQRPLHHMGIEVAADEFDRERERLQGLGYDVRYGEHPYQPLRGLYIDDPDGNEVELIAPRP